MFIIVRSAFLSYKLNVEILYRQKHRVQQIDLDQHERNIQLYGPGKSEAEIRFPCVVFFSSNRSHLIPAITGNSSMPSP